MQKKVVVFGFPDELIQKVAPFLNEMEGLRKELVEAEVRLGLVTDAVALAAGHDPVGLEFDPARWELVKIEEVDDPVDGVKDLMKGIEEEEI